MSDNETLDSLLKSLDTTLDGLTSEEAKSRLLKFGPNEVKEKRRSPVIEFLLKFWAPVPWMLEVTVVLTFILQKYLDMYIILFLLVLTP